MIVFRVAGYIELKSPVRIRQPFITIAGQSAPGDGICLKNYALQIGNTQHVIIRHLRCRPGDKTSAAGEMDAITIWDSQHVILDHCSATWSTDECLSVTRDSDHITVQFCLLAEALTSHSMGSIIGGDGGRVSFLNNFYAKKRSRNPRAS
ncbi:MAG: pectate lyase, partial [Planctomycetaceae bacterium]